MENILKQELIKNAVAKLDEPWKNLTVKDVAKDLKKKTLFILKIMVYL